jgi:NADH dehydrogenase FAD-containing subunit
MTERPDTVGRENPRVVIVGGGFGGLEAAKALAKADAEVVLFDRHNHRADPEDPRETEEL